MRKSKGLAFILSFIFGIGHMYLGRKVRGVIYPLFFLGSAFISGFAAFGLSAMELAIAFFIIGSLIWIINILDMMITVISGTDPAFAPVPNQLVEELQTLQPSSSQDDRALTLFLSIVPGLGHLQLGLMNRGLTFLLGFFGSLTMIIFVSALTNQEGFLIFLGALPVLWLYNMFDVVQLLQRKRQGEELVDRSIFEELEEQRETGRKSKMFAMFLAILPGASHMYLGLQRRGLQLMAAFLFSIYILDVLRLSLFLFIIPILWFFSFFDALQYIAKEGKEPLKDIPVVDWLMNHQRWLGIGLLALGMFYLIQQMILPFLELNFPEWHITQWFDQYFQTAIVSLILIIGGIRLMTGSRVKSKGVKE